jgi:hypothetical protein
LGSYGYGRERQTRSVSPLRAGQKWISVRSRCLCDEL